MEERIAAVDGCNFFITRKQRYCKMTVKEGHSFCGEHEPKIDTNTECSDVWQRVVCPYDPTHSCYARWLSKHMRKCNARPSEQPAYIVPGINVSQLKTNEVLTLAETEDEDLIKLIQKLKAISEALPGIAEEVLCHPALLNELNNPEYGPNTRKHRLQNASLLSHIEQSNLIQPDTCFIEFGAGRGQLSFWLGKVVCNCEHHLMLLVDKKHHRNSFDKQVEFKSNVNSQRLRADIADLCLANLETIQEYKNWVAISKHLCGAGTDLAIRCLTSGCNEATKVGAVMAPCCHHRGDWDNYVGQEFFLANGISPKEFSLMCGIASWATCGMSKNKVEECHEGQSERYHHLHLSPEDKEAIGKKCKQILDYGRLKYLEGLDFKCKLVYYISEQISPENLCIVAVKS